MFVPQGPINIIPALVHIMTWGRPGDKPLSEPMMISFLTHICVTRPQWVNWLNAFWPSEAIWHCRSGSTLSWVKIMICCLLGAKTLSEPVLTYFQLDPWEQNKVKFESKYKKFLLTKYIWKCCIQNFIHFSSGLNTLNYTQEFINSEHYRMMRNVKIVNIRTCVKD